MSRGDYKRAIEAAKRELADLVKERQGIDRRLARLQESIRGLSALCETNDLALPPPPESIRDSGFTDAIRSVLQASPFPMTPVQVRDSLVSRGYSLDEYTNPLASIHTILKRLEAKREVKVVRGMLLGEIRYQWVTGLEQLLSDLLSQPPPNLAPAPRLPPPPERTIKRG